MLENGTEVFSFVPLRKKPFDKESVFANERSLAP